MTDELKPCPFCGNKKILSNVYTRDGRKTQCSSCGVCVTVYNGPNKNTAALADEKWNARAEQTEGMVSKAAVVEKLLAINAGRLKEVPKDISPTSANIVLYKTDAVVDAIAAIEAMPCSDGSANSSLFDAMETWFNSFKLDYSDKYRQEKKDMAAGNLLIEIRQFLKDKGAR